MDVASLVKRLEAFGLDAGEAKLYFHMSRLGPARAAELSERAGIHRTDIYRLAEGLVRKGFAEKTLERPVKFAPLPLEIVFGKQDEQEKGRIEERALEAKRLVEEWPNQAAAWASTAHRFAVHQGMPHIQALFQRMVDDATDEVVLVMNRKGLARLGIGAMHGRLEKRAKDGVKVRILTKIDAANVDDLRQIAVACDVRHVDLTGYHQMLIVDNKEIALFVSAGRSQSVSGVEETVLWLNAHDFVLAQKSLVDRAWRAGVTHEDMSWALSAGSSPPEVSLVRGHWLIISKIKQILSRCEEAMLVVPAAVQETWWQQGIGRIVAIRRKQGKDIRVGVHGERGEDSARGFVAAAQLVPFPIIATRNEILIVRTAPGVAAKEDWALHSTFPDMTNWGWGVATSCLESEQSGEKNA